MIDDLGTCGTSLVLPKQSVLGISIWSTCSAVLTVTHVHDADDVDDDDDKY